MAGVFRGENANGIADSDLLEQKGFFGLLFALIARKTTVGRLHPFTEMKVFGESFEDGI